MNKKIFCVGLNKTGTSSLHDAFLMLNIESVHFKG
ncbi:MAG: sulfotransferase, partial [Paraglaciecola chathamensis]